MRGKRAVLVSTCLCYLLQLALIACWWHLAATNARTNSLLIGAALAVVAGLADVATAKYLLATIRRVEQAHARVINERLERSFESYRLRAEQERALLQKLGIEIEEELEKARKALASGSWEEMDAHLDQGLSLASEIRTAGCGNIAVTAVLEEKMRQCEEAGLTLDAHVSLPEECGIPDIEVAAIFFNLIDNAFNECSSARLKGMSGSPVISVRSFVAAGQMIINVHNPCQSNTTHTSFPTRAKGNAPEHGWGTGIVSDIARMHGGMAEFGEKEGVFHAAVMIPISMESE